MGGPPALQPCRCRGGASGPSLAQVCRQARIQQHASLPPSLPWVRVLAPQHSCPDPTSAPSLAAARRIRANSRRCPGGRRHPRASSRPGGCRGCRGRGAGGQWRGCPRPPWSGQLSRPPGSGRSTRPARRRQSLAELVHSSRELRSHVRWPGSPPLPCLGPGTTLQIPASGINSNRLFS